MSNSYIPPDLPIPASVVDPESTRGPTTYCLGCDADYWECMDNEEKEGWDIDKEFCPECENKNEQQKEEE